MSFDIFLQYAQRETPPNADLDSVVERVVRDFGGGVRDEFGYFFGLADGGYVEFFFSADSDHGMLALRTHTLTRGVVRFTRALMAETGWVVLIPNETLCAAALQPIPANEIHDGFPELTIVSGEDELAELLAPGFDAWATYKDQVTG